jgi:hypothetical protein
LTAFADSAQAAGGSFQQSYSPKSGKLSPSQITLGLLLLSGPRVATDAKQLFKASRPNRMGMVERTEVPCLGPVAAYGGCCYFGLRDTDKFVAAHWIGDRLLRLTGMYQPQSGWNGGGYRCLPRPSTRNEGVTPRRKRPTFAPLSAILNFNDERHRVCDDSDGMEVTARRAVAGNAE